MAVVAVWIYVILVSPNQLPISTANGAYSNGCCDTIKLNDGEMFIGSQLVSYTIQADKGGPYVLTQGYVGVLVGGKFEISPSKYPEKMRLGGGSQPAAIEIMGQNGIYRFARTPANGS